MKVGSRTSEPLVSQLGKWEGLRNQHYAAFRGHLNSRRADLLALAHSIGPLSPEYAALKEKHERADFQYQTINRVLLRPLNSYSIGWPYIAVFTLGLAILETPVNKFIFDIALYGANIMSWAVSFAFAVFILVLAHLAGKSIRQIYSDYHSKVVWHLGIVFVVCVAMLSLMISILMIARDHLDKLRSAQNSEASIFAQITESVTTTGLWDALGSAFTNPNALTLLAVNVGAIFMTALLSYFTHDSDKDYDSAHRMLERLDKKQSGLNRKYGRKQTNIIDEAHTGSA